MKELPLSFQSNNDSCGLHLFTQLKKEGSVHLYRRDRQDGSVHSYEVFVSKLIKAGAKLPNGTVEADDRYSYPGAQSFGAWARSCKTFAQADGYFDEFVKAENTPDVIKEQVVYVKTGLPRGKKKVDFSINWPQTFTMNELAAKNPTIKKYNLYNRMKEEIVKGSVVCNGKAHPSGVKRGMPELSYSKV